MQKWEYLEVVFIQQEKGYLVFFNDLEMGNRETIQGYINGLGKEGWELVSEHHQPSEQLEYSIDQYIAEINDETAAYLADKYPDYDPPKFAMKSLEFDLDESAKHGWQLIHLQPVAGIGENDDVLFIGEMYRYSHTYFAVYSRKKDQGSRISMRFKRPKVE